MAWLLRAAQPPDQSFPGGEILLETRVKTPLGIIHRLTSGLRVLAGIKIYQRYTTCSNPHFFPNTVQSHVYATLAPLPTNLPVNPCVPVLVMLSLLSFVVVWTITWL